MKKNYFSALSTFLVSLATFMLAFIAFNQYTIEMRPKLFFSEVSDRPFWDKVGYTLYNSGSGTAHDVSVEFNCNAQFFDKDLKLIKEYNEKPKTKDVDHLYPNQTKDNTLYFEVERGGARSVKVLLSYKIKYKGKFLFFFERDYFESGKIKYDSKSYHWLLIPD